MENNYNIPLLSGNESYKKMFIETVKMDVSLLERIAHSGLPPSLDALDGQIYIGYQLPTKQKYAIGFARAGDHALGFYESPMEQDSNEQLWTPQMITGSGPNGPMRIPALGATGFLFSNGTMVADRDGHIIFTDHLSCGIGSDPTLIVGMKRDDKSTYVLAKGRPIIDRVYQRMSAGFRKILETGSE